MRVDCINRCFGDKTNRNDDKCIYPFYYRLFLWRNYSAYSSYHDLKMCDNNDLNPDIINERVQVRRDCEMKCRPDCVNRYYKKTIKGYEKKELLFNYKVPLNTTDILYFPNNLPDQITQHIEEMSFVDFSGTFGGLVGVWLGFSIATVISDLMVIIRDKYLKNFIMPI